MTTYDAQTRPHIVVLGAGFGGLRFCQALKADARITMVDRHNHHLFQPLLYQVATAGLSAPDVSEPVRSIFRHDPRITVLMDAARAIDLCAKQVRLSQQTLAYDYLVIGLGGVPTYFGHDEWREYAPPLKTINDAMRMRWMLLRSFELAENTDDEAERRRLMTIVVIGGGPTGVELAGAVAELTKVVFKRDFRRIDPTQARVVLVEGGPRLLDAFPAPLGEKALRQVRSLGVEVVLDKRVTDIQADRVTLTGGDVIETRNVLWGAGVVANPITATLGIPLGPGGRIPVLPDLSIPGHPDAFAIGDIVTLRDARGVLAPGLAPAAMQMGRHVARIIDAQLRHQPAASSPIDPRQRPAYTYSDKGSMATIGRKRAIAKIGKLELSGLPAWVAWLLVHLIFLIGFRNKLAVMISWVYSYVTFKRGARIIFDPAPLSPATEDAAAAQRTATPPSGSAAPPGSAAAPPRGVQDHNPAQTAYAS